MPSLMPFLEQCAGSPASLGNLKHEPAIQNQRTKPGMVLRKIGDIPCPNPFFLFLAKVGIFLAKNEVSFSLGAP